MTSEPIGGKLSKFSRYSYDDAVTCAAAQRFQSDLCQSKRNLVQSEGNLILVGNQAIGCHGSISEPLLDENHMIR